MVSEPKPSNEASSEDLPEDVEAFLEVDEEFICPISGTIMRDPCIVANCGHSFGRTAIYEWIAKSQICPVCKIPTKQSDILPNYSLKKIIEKQILKAKEVAKKVNEPESSLQGKTGGKDP